MCLFGTQKVKLHSNKLPTFILLCTFTNEKTVKLMQIDRLLFEFGLDWLFASKTSVKSRLTKVNRFVSLYLKHDFNIINYSRYH